MTAGRDIRADFPAIANNRFHGREFAYLDSAATALKPRCVIDAVSQVYARDCGNVHRGVHALAQRATAAFEDARTELARFLNAPSRELVIFVRGTTEAINLLAWGYVAPRLQPGDEILVTELEHHSNIVPWQMVAAQRGARLVAAPIDDDGQLDVAGLAERLGPRTRVVSVAHVGNALGTIVPVAEIVALVRERAPAAIVAVDGAQAVPHMAVDVAALDCDFYALSGHKLYGPTGVGALFGKREHLARMAPWQGGGDMIESVSLSATTYAALPHRFEAGTPNIAGVIGLGAALRYIDAIGYPAIREREDALMDYALGQLARVPGLRIIGPSEGRMAVISFVMSGVHAHDIGTICDARGVAIRTGHHCAQPLMERLGLEATARLSLGVYNTRADIDALIQGLHDVRSIFPLPDTEPNPAHDSRRAGG